MAQQLDLFLSTLPRRTWATDTLGCMRIVERAEAAGKAYVAPNARWERRWLVFDIDRPTATIDWQDRAVPSPNLTAMNRENGHAHAFYGLALPLHTDPAKAGKSLRYGAAIEAALREALDGDISYGGPLAKNPLSDRWLVQEWQQAPYTLDWLRDYPGLELARYDDRRKRLPDYGLGRNVTVFNSLRLWSYRHVLAAKAGSFNHWFDQCIERAREYNAQFPAALGEREVRGIAKSVARWTWERFSVEAFKAHQARVGRLGGLASGVARQRASDLKRQLLLDFLAASPGHSVRSLSRITDLPRSTVERLLKASHEPVSRVSHEPLSGLEGLRAFGAREG